MAIQTHPPLKSGQWHRQSTRETPRQATRAAHGVHMDYYDPTGAHIVVRYEGTVDQGGHDYRVERDGIFQGLITCFPGGTWQATNVDGRTSTGFSTPLAAAGSLLTEAGVI